MGKRKYLPLTPSEVVSTITALGFVLKRRQGSHAHYEGIDESGKRAIVTVDEGYDQFDETRMKSMIAQSGFDREKFYGATKQIAKRAGLKQYTGAPPKKPQPVVGVAPKGE
jgi:predicted RNA binding protein YcfA (HicA-like mRNA interferase family)